MITVVRMRPIPRTWLPGLCAVALAAASFAGCGRAPATPDDDGRAVAVKFLDELRAGQLEPAWQGTSTEFKSLMGVENLRDYVKAHPVLKQPAEFAESKTLEQEGHSLAEYRFRATSPAKGKTAAGSATIRVVMARGAEGWQVEHLAVE